MGNKELWDITNREQTQLKLDILEKYLRAWANIIGSSFSESYYIDGFAGRGKYHKLGVRDGVLGSPLIAQKIGLEVQEAKQKKGKSYSFKIIAIEANKKNFEDLSKFFKQNDYQGKIIADLINGDFQALIPDIIENIGSSPSFFFIDPYGIKIPKEALDFLVERAAKLERTEIFLNYMSMGVRRVAGLKRTIQHHEEIIRLRAIKSLTRLDELFGDKSWIEKEEQELLLHFTQQVLKRGYKVVLNFNVPYPDRSGTFYNLLFATNNLIAKKIMGEIFSKKMFEGTLFEKMPFEVDHEL